MAFIATAMFRTSSGLDNDNPGAESMTAFLSYPEGEVRDEKGGTGCLMPKAKDHLLGK